MAALGIEHIGMTVPDIDAATTFFDQAFGATLVYEGLSRSDPPMGGPDCSTRSAPRRAQRCGRYG